MSDMEIVRIQKEENDKSGADPLGLTAAQLNQLYDMGCGKSLLWLMRATWIDHGFPAEPYSDVAALEIAINELVDEARERGGRVTYCDTEIGSPCGLCVRLPDGQEEQP